MAGFSVGQKLGAGFAVLICLLILQGYTSIAVIGTLSTTLDRSSKKASESSTLINGIESSVAEMRDFGKMAQFAYAINVTLDKNAAGNCLSCHTLPNSGETHREFETLAGGVRAKLQALAATGLSAEEKEPLDKVDRSTKEWSAVFGEFLADASAHQFVTAHSITIDRLEPIRQRMLKETKELETAITRSTERSQADAAAYVKQKTTLLIWLQVAILLPTIFLAWRFIRSLAAKLRVLGTAAHCIALGDVDGALSKLTTVGL